MPLEMLNRSIVISTEMNFIMFDGDPNELKLNFIFLIFLLQNVFILNLFIKAKYARLFIYFIIEY